MQDVPPTPEQDAALRELQGLVDRADKLTMDLAIARRDLQQLRGELQMFIHRWRGRV
jgi:hypothetical protein